MGNRIMTFIGHMKKQKLVLFAALIICAAVITGGTLAFFTADETAYNVITTGSLSMDLIELTTDGQPFPEKGIDGVMPGTSVDKIPFVKNTGSVDFYTRVTMEMRMTAADGSTLSDKFVSLDINTKDWTEKDGYYYYNYNVKPGEETKPLFTKVSFDKLMDNPYMNARLEIDIHAEAVQSKNNTDSPLTAEGWVSAN